MTRPQGGGSLRCRCDIIDVVATITDDPHRTPLLLTSDTAILKQDGVSRSVSCRIFQTLSISSSVYLEFSGTKKDDFFDNGPVDVYLRRSGVRFRGYTVGIEVRMRFAEGRRSLKQQIVPESEPIAGRASRTLNEVDFAVANGTQFILDRQFNGKSLDALKLEADDWSVNILSLSADHKSIEDKIDGDGTKLTHSGTLRRKNGGLFRSEEAMEVLSALSLFLSFAAGWWVGIGFVRGRNTMGKITWQLWGFTRVQQGAARHSWHHWRMDGMLARLFPGFVSLLQQPSWREPLETILYWYNRSNSMAAGVDGSIILNQAAFELLAWQVLVQDSKMLSADNFQSLNAEGQIRVLLGHLGIPLTIPAGLTELVKVAKEFNWSCGPQALVAIRNQLVHPAKKRGSAHHAKSYPYFESWLLVQHLLELCILRLCKYQGTYIDRTNQGLFPTPIRVPWSCSK